jgi:hypothetical protein
MIYGKQYISRSDLDWRPVRCTVIIYVTLSAQFVADASLVCAWVELSTESF